MKKMIKNIGFYLVGILLLASCFDDDGNYEYKKFDTPTINFTFKSSTSTSYIGDPIIFEPIVTNDSVVDTTQYSWEYYFSGYGLVCTTRVMNMVFPDIKQAASFGGVCKAYNRVTGQYKTYNCSFSYKNRYDVGWLVLADDNNASKLNLVKTLDDSIFTLDKDITQMLGEQALGTGPKRLIYNDINRTEVRVLQNSGNVILQNVLYYSLGTFENEFSEGAYPANFVPKYFALGANVGAIQGEDGRVFVKTFNSAAVYTAEKWMTAFPLRHEGRELNAKYMLTNPHASSTLKHVLLYDQDVNGFYVLAGNGFNANTGAAFPLYVKDSTGTAVKMDMSAYEIQHCQLRNSSSTTMEVFSVLKEKETGKYFYYSFIVKATGYTVQTLTASSVTFIEVPASVASLMKEGTKYHMHHTTTATMSHLFIVSPDEPNKLYVTNTVMRENALAEEYKSFAAPIVAMGSHKSTTNLGLGLENGKFYILNIHTDILTDLVAMDDQKVRAEQQVDGKIVDVCYKYK